MKPFQIVLFFLLFLFTSCTKFLRKLHSCKNISTNASDLAVGVGGAIGLTSNTAIVSSSVPKAQRFS